MLFLKKRFIAAGRAMESVAEWPGTCWLVSEIRSLGKLRCSVVRWCAEVLPYPSPFPEHLATSPTISREEVVVSTKLYVGSLPYSTTEQELTELFSQYGSVQSAKMITDRYTGQSR